MPRRADNSARAEPSNARPSHCPLPISPALGRFRRDSTLGSTVAALRDELTVLQITVDSADGNVKRFKSDSALTRSVEDSRRAMSQLFDDIRRRPFHYVHF